MTQAEINKKEVAEINEKFNSGEITFDEAMKELTKVAARINEAGRRIAKKYGRKFSPFTAHHLIRHEEVRK